MASEEERRKRKGSFPLGAKKIGGKEKKKRKKKERSEEGKTWDKRGRKGKRKKKIEDFPAF